MLYQTFIITKHNITIMKKLFILAALIFSLSASAQKVTDTLVIKLDTTTYKYITTLIRENIDSRTVTGQTILNNILLPLSKWTFLQPADKPKELPKPVKNN